jgi:hypothetical protein
MNIICTQQKIDRFIQYCFKHWFLCIYLTVNGYGTQLLKPLPSPIDIIIGY